MAISRRLQNRRRLSRGGRPISACPSLKSETDCALNENCIWNMKLSKCRKAPPKRVSKKMTSNNEDKIVTADKVKTKAMADKVKTKAIAEKVKAEAMDDKVKAEAMDDKVKAEAMDDKVKAEAMDDKIKAHNDNLGPTADNFLYQINYASTSRATCRFCKKKINKGELRVTRFDENNPFGDGDLIHHFHADHAFDAFIKSRCSSAPIIWEKLNGTKNVLPKDLEYIYHKIKEFNVKWENKCKTNK